MNSEKVKEIKKALDNCKGRHCVLCPRFSLEPKQEEDCRLALIGQSLSLINDMESENERLKQHKRELQGGQQDLTKRIAELEKVYDRQVRIINDLNIEVVKEQKKLPKFAERLKEEFIKSANIQDSITAKKLFRDICPVKVEKILKKTLKEFINE